MLELVLRINGYGKLEIYEPDPALYWRLKPNQKCYTKIDHKPVRINSQGTRGPEFEATKRPDTIRILSLGDSRTFGWGLAEEETYSLLFQRCLQQKIGSAKNIEVINAGVNAWSYAQILTYFRHTGVTYRPDIVILGEANLWTQFSEQNSPQFVEKFMLRVRLKNFLRRFAIYHYVVELKLKNFYERHRTKFIPVEPGQDTLFKEQQKNEPDAAFRSAIENLCSLSLSNHIQPILLYLPVLQDLGPTNTSSVLKLKREVAEKWSIPLVNPAHELQSGGKDFYLEADPVHLNYRGNQIIARALFDTVARFSN